MLSAQNIFVTHKHITGVYSLLAEAAVLHFAKSRNIKIVSHQEMNNRKFDIYVLWSACKVLAAYISGALNFFSRRPYYIFEVGNVEFGKYITASVLRDAKAGETPLTFFCRYQVSLLRAIFVYGSALRNKNKLSGIFLGDTAYLDGIWVDFFLNRENVDVYLMMQPYNVICVSRSYASKGEFQRSLGARGRELSPDNMVQADEFMERRLQDPGASIYYYRAENEPLRPIGEKNGKPSVIIYAHSFTDAQLDFGFDGFKSVYDWLTFTLKTLERLGDRVNVYLKAHPNFYSEETESKRETLDKKIWLGFVENLPSNINVVDYPVSNLDLLQNFDTKTDVLISHHGNAVVEGAHLGFNSISSEASAWSTNYKFSHLWSSKAEYRSLISEIDKLPPLADQQRLTVYDFVSHFFLREKSDFSECFFLSVIAKHTNVSVLQLIKNPTSVIELGEVAHKLLVEHLALCIGAINPAGDQAEAPSCN